jgi:transcriptional regulator
MAKLTAIKTIKKIQEMRNQGVKFSQIASELGISSSTAHIHGRNYSPEQKRNTLNKCGHLRSGLRCVRNAGHRGIHQADTIKGLIYWE